MNGRDGEVGRVLRLLDSGRPVVVRASAGMGKTSLLRNVLARRDAETLRALPSQSAKSIPFGAFAALIPIPFGDSTDRLAGAIAHLRTDPRLIVVDDAHLLDDESATLLHLVASERPLLITVRSDHSCPDGVHRLSTDQIAETVDLLPLSLAEMTELAESFVNELVDSQTLEFLHASSEGNPLWAREILAANKRAGTLRRVDGVWSIREFVGAMSVRELLRERVDTWSPTVRRVASVLASAVAAPDQTLAEVCGRAALHEAVLAGAVHARDRDGLYELSHPLLAEAVNALETSDTRRCNLEALVEASGIVGSELFTLVSSWLLELGAHGAADAELLMAAARTSFDGTQPAHAQRLAEAAVRAGAGREAGELLVRIRSARGDSDAEPVNQGERRANAIGATEAFSYGFRPAEGVRGMLLDAMASEDNVDLKAELQVFDLAVGLQLGDPIEPITRALLELTDSNAGNEVVRVAAVTAATSLVIVGRYERAISLCNQLDADTLHENIFQKMSLAVSGAEALLWSGHASDAIRRADQRLRTGPGSDSMVGEVFRSGFDSQLALVQGNPHLACRLAGSVVALVNGINASGVLSWTQALLRWALAWTGQALTDDSVVVPPQGQLLAPRIALYHCMATAEEGSVRDARRLALDLCDLAEGAGHYATALHAVHLAGRIHPTRNLVERAVSLRSRVDGDLAIAIVDHVASLLSADGAGLEKVAGAFEVSGHLALAHEVFLDAAVAHGQYGAQRPVGRCRAEASRLRTGVVPTFAARRSVADADGLTVRESEVAALAAEGKTNREIGLVLGLSGRTIESHLQRAYTKLGVNDRAFLTERLKSEK